MLTLRPIDSIFASHNWPNRHVSVPASLPASVSAPKSTVKSAASTEQPDKRVPKSAMKSAYRGFENSRYIMPNVLFANDSFSRCSTLINRHAQQVRLDFQMV